MDESTVWQLHHVDEFLIVADADSQRDDSITVADLSMLRGLLGPLLSLATQVIPQLQAP